MEYIAHYRSPLGGITLSCDGEALTGLWFDGQKYFGATLAKEWEERTLPVLEEAGRWLDRYFAGQKPDGMPPLRPKGTAFRQEVWAILRQIPYGCTVTYGEIAGQIAARHGLPSMSAQAVGGAVGHNPISIFIPCHRVLGGDGGLVGYAGGLEKKRRLLELEKMTAPGERGCGSSRGRERTVISGGRCGDKIRRTTGRRP